MEKNIPIYRIDEFQQLEERNDFYANFVNPHVKNHHFTKFPHKHDFYLVILITQGTGKHEIDFKSYDVTPGTLFILKPGEMHYWEFSEDIDGYIFFHSKEFYEKGNVNSNLKDFDFYSSFQNTPVIEIEGGVFELLKGLMKELVHEQMNSKLMKWQKIHALITLIYINVSREYKTERKSESTTYLRKVRMFEDYIEVNFKTVKLARDYAGFLNVSEKHLNRMTKACFNKTSTELISERLVLEAKRMLMHSEWNVNQIADELGFNEASYFIRFFKKLTGVTPLNFLKAYVKER